MREPFEEAVQRHGAVVLRVCRAALGPGPDAEEAWSETFLAALKVWPTLPEDVNVQAWLVRVAQRKTVDLIRAQARHGVAHAEVPDRPSALGNPDDEKLLLWWRVAELPERQRLAVAYHYLGGLPHGETAAIIGGSAAAVRRAAADGIKNLRSSYQREGDDHDEPR